MEDRLKLLISALGEDRVKQNTDISEHLHTRLGVAAEAFYIATSSRELVRVIKLCQELKIPYLVIGLGSKIALPALGTCGLIIKNRSDHAKIFGIKGKVSRDGLRLEEAIIEVGSGMSLTRLCQYAGTQGLGGLEDLDGVPGTIGGSIRINPVLQDKVSQVEVLNKDGELLPKEFSQIDPRDTILSATFKLKAKKSGNGV